MFPNLGRNSGKLAALSVFLILIGLSAFVVAGDSLKDFSKDSVDYSQEDVSVLKEVIEFNLDELNSSENATGGNVTNFSDVIESSVDEYLANETGNEGGAFSISSYSIECSGCGEKIIGCLSNEDCNSPPGSPMCYAPGICNENNQCVYTFSDETGPTTSDLTVTKVFGSCKIDIDAKETDLCSNITSAEYFFGSSCGAPGTGTPMDPADGLYNSLMENVMANSVPALDGSIDIWVRGEDSSGNWGTCKHVSFASDCLPPRYPTCRLGNTIDTTQGSPGIVLNDQCSPSELLVCSADPTIKANICDLESHIQLAEYFLDDMPLINWEGINMTAIDGLYGDTYCEDVQATINLSQLYEGTHYVQLHGKDTQENWGKLPDSPKVSFIKDTVSPVTEKSMEFPGEFAYSCGLEYANGHEITDGCEYVKAGTNITLSAYDPDTRDHEIAGNPVIHYNIYYSHDCLSESPEWTLNSSGQGNPNESVTLTLNEDSCHLIEYWSTDLCSNEEEHHFELDIVDTQPPVINKTVGDPKVSAPEESGYDYYITQNTPICIVATDPQPHPVGHVFISCSVKQWNTDPSGEPDDQYEVELDKSGCFNFEEDSYHEINCTAVDGLGNEAEPFIEKDIVDTEPPEINKTITGPHIGDCPPESYGDECFIGNSTIIHVNATDPEPHPVNNVSCNWSYWIMDGEGSGGQDNVGSAFNISFQEESKHKLIIKCEDALGNSVIDWEKFLVDLTPPETFKLYGQPFFSNETSEWITSETLINFIATDEMGPHVSGVNFTRFRVTLVNDSYCFNNNLCQEFSGSGEWENYDEPFSIPDESCHMIEFYSEDNVGNEESVNRQCVFVDNTPPLANKSVGLPQYPCTDGTEKCGPEETGWQPLYVNQSTPITFSCEDQLPHPVGNEQLCFKVSWDEGEGMSYITQEYAGEDQLTKDGYYCPDVDNWSYTFNFQEDSLHNLEWYCQDYLGNTGGVNIEYDNVDSQPPWIIVHNPTISEAANMTLCMQSIVIEAGDFKSGLNESSIYAKLLDSEGDTVEYVNLTKSPYGTYEGIMDKQHPVGNYTLSICASDNLGNKNCRNISEYLPETLTVQFINPGSCTVDPLTGGECDFTFNVCMRGGNGLQFWMNKLGEVVTPGDMNATVSNETGSAIVGLRHTQPDYADPFSCENAGFIWDDDTCWSILPAEFLQLDPFCEDINSTEEFDLHLNITNQTAQLIGPGIHNLEYWIETSLQSPPQCIPLEEID